jgi:hypothetical protein
MSARGFAVCRDRGHVALIESQPAAPTTGLQKNGETFQEI